jgi:hypothetical protein
MNADKGTSLFWLFVSIVVSVAAFRLGLGKLNAPGSGFMPFGAAVLLGLLSIACFLQAVLREKTKPAAASLFRGTLWYRVVFSCLALRLRAGDSFLRLQHHDISVYDIPLLDGRATENAEGHPHSLGTTIITYYVFSKSLNLQFSPALRVLEVVIHGCSP